ncbi:hypothetical protein WJX72_012335 [[Myrmecia] bisecta]|uniref:PROP1-like PPR domain-containing protein n=1 Tax=[Myrmecia] bisecta TaxID=41462 RepID=A0AAW1QH09_9CHLO
MRPVKTENAHLALTLSTDHRTPTPASCRASFVGQLRHTCPLSRSLRPQPARLTSASVRHVVRPAAAGGESSEQVGLAPAKPKSPVGEMLAYYAKQEPHLFRAAIEEQLLRIRDQREEEKKAAPEAPKSTDKSELVLYRRMQDLKRNEQRATVEDLMYASVLEKFLEVGVDMLPRIDNVIESPTNLKALTEGIHTKEALEMVKEHVRNIMGPASVAYSNSMIKMSKLQAAQVYAASIMFGYFVRRVDKRFQLERSLGLLPDEDAMHRLEKLFAEADALELSDDPDSPSKPSNSADTSSTTSSSTSSGQASTSGYASDASSGLPGTMGGGGTAPGARPKSALRKYIESFNQETMVEMTRLVSAEGAALVEMQTSALFGNLSVLQKQMQEAVGQDANSMEELMERVQKVVADGQVESVTITVGTQRRAVLEAVAFGTFLRDVETHVDNERTPYRHARKQHFCVQAVRIGNNRDGSVTYSFEDDEEEDSDFAQAIWIPTPASTTASGSHTGTQQLEHVEPTLGVEGAAEGPLNHTVQSDQVLARIQQHQTAEFSQRPHAIDFGLVQSSNGHSKRSTPRSSPRPTGEPSDGSSSHHRIGRLEGALKLVEEMVHADRTDALSRLKHKHFLHKAADLRAVKEAFRFVQVLPRRYVDSRTYNMLVSVCVRAKDLAAALRAGDMLKSTGSKLDTILYTNLIHACAVAGNADAAFKLYSEMKAEKVGMERQVFSTLINACSREILATPPGDRRTQLVLLERAAAVFGEMQAAAIKPDLPVWNSFITAAGRAGQLQRAFQALEDMQGFGNRPNVRTYAALIDACGRSQQKALALRVYSKALMEGLSDSLLIYASAIFACRSPQQVDLQSALRIFADMQRNGVQADAGLYASLMLVAGSAGDVELAFELDQEMKLEGFKPSQETCSALMMVCIENEQLERAHQLYQDMRQHKLQPHLHAFNALINAYGRSSRLGDAVSGVTDMIAAGHEPDQFTFAAVLNACQRADEADVAFEVFRIMKKRGLRVDEAVCFILLRLCYNGQRASWYPGGYPPGKTQSQGMPGARSAAGMALLQALSGSAAPVEYDAREVNWVSRAMSVYREAVAGGVTLRLHVLDRLLACLRLPHSADDKNPGSAGAMPTFKVGSYMLAESANVEAQLQPAGRLFDSRAVTILEEAISVGSLPQFRLDRPCLVDMRRMPPTVAEVYVLAMLTALRRSADPSGQKYHPITFLVPPYHTAEVFFPSYAHEPFEAGVSAPEAASVPARSHDSLTSLEDEEVEKRAGSPASLAGMWDDAEEDATASTGLGVAGMLRRLHLWAKESPGEGQLVVEGRALARWLRIADRAATNARSSALSALQEQGWIGSGLKKQQQNIRLGMSEQDYRSRPPTAGKNAGWSPFGSPSDGQPPAGY